MAFRLKIANGNDSNTICNMVVQTLAFTEFAASRIQEIDAALERYTDFDSECPARLRDAIRHSLLAPAKRLRPLLVLMAGEACG